MSSVGADLVPSIMFDVFRSQRNEQEGLRTAIQPITSHYNRRNAEIKHLEFKNESLVGELEQLNSNMDELHNNFTA